MSEIQRTDIIEPATNGPSAKRDVLDRSMDKRSRFRKIIRNFGFLAAGKTLGDTFTFLLFVIISRTFGQEGVGQYSFAIAFTGFFAIFVDFGLYALSIKEMSRRSGRIDDYYGLIFTLRLGVAFAVFATMLISVPFLPFSSETKLIIALVGSYQVLAQLFTGFMDVFIAREETHFAGLLEAGLRVGIGIIVGGIILVGGSLVFALAALPVITAGQLALAYGIVTWKYGRPRFVISAPRLLRLARQALPYTMSIFLVQVYSRIDVVFLGFIIGAGAAGVYNVAFRFLFLLLFIPHFAAVAVLPLASRLYSESEMGELRDLYHKVMNHIVLVGLPAAAGLWLVAPDVIPLIYTNAFDESVVILRLLSGLLFLAFLSRVIAALLTACDRQPTVTRMQWIAAAVNVAGNAIMIPTVGIKGAAIATLASETLLVVLLAVQLTPLLGRPRISSKLAISAAGVASFIVPFGFLAELSMAVVVPASALLYTATLIAFKETRTNEIRMILTIIRRKAHQQTPAENTS